MKLASVVVLALALSGCRPDVVKPGGATPAPDALTPEEERELAKQVYGEAIQRHGGYLALASNAGDQRSSIKRFNLGFEVFKAKERFPQVPDVPGVERAVRALASTLGLPVVSLSITPRKLERRPLPAEVPDGTSVELTPDDVRGVLDIELVLGGAPTPARLEQLARETIELPRLVWWSKAQPAGQDGAPAVSLRGEAYWFFADTVVPRVAHQPPRLEEFVARAGLLPVPRDPGAREQLEKARPLFAEMAEKLNDYKEVLELIRHTRLLAARFTVVRKARARQDGAVTGLRVTP